MSTYTRKNKVVLQILSRTLAVIGTVLAIVLLALLAFTFIVARGPYSDASAKLCATLAARNRDVCGIFFTTDEIDRALTYNPPRESSDTVADFSFEPTDGSYEILKYELSDDGWNGVVLKTVTPGAFSAGITVGTSGRATADISLGLEGYVDAIYVSKCLTYAGNGGDDLYCVVASDPDGKLHIGAKTVYEITRSGYSWAVSADRVLVADGKPVLNLGGGYFTGAAIGQAADGTLIVFYAASKGVWPRGITYDELASVMYGYGAVTAAAISPKGSLQQGSNLLLGTVDTPDYTLCINKNGGAQ